MDKLAELEKELLEEMEAKPEAYEVQEQTVCVIDNNLRTINIPPDLKNLGVESDDDVHRIFFQMPKSYGEFDLAEFDIRINYKNGNIGDVYAVEDKAAETDVITFSWLVGRNAVKTKGQTQFIVCLKKTDVSGNVIHELNTTVASLNVLEGLETTEKVVQENPDVIEQILKRLDGVTEIPQEQIQEAVEVYLLEHPIQETDPTVYDWAKQPEKPKYTASEVGAIPDTTKIPSKTSDLQNDSGFTTLMLDESLTDNTKAAPAGMVGELKGDIEQLKQNGGSGSGTENVESRLKGHTMGVIGDSLSDRSRGVTQWFDWIASRAGGMNLSLDCVSGRRLMQFPSDGLSNQCDIICVFGGTNDFNSAQELGTLDTANTDGKTTFYGAVYTLATELMTNYPKSVIIFITPLSSAPAYNSAENYKWYEYPSMGGHSMKDFCDAIKEVCCYLHIPVVDLFENSGLNYNYDTDNIYFVSDKLHLTDAGQEAISYVIEKKILEHYIPDNANVTEVVTLSSISAEFTQGDSLYYPSSSLSDLKENLAVSATYSDGTSNVITDYSLSGTLTEGISTITVNYLGKTATFEVAVLAEGALEPFVATLTPDATLRVGFYYENDFETLETKSPYNNNMIGCIYSEPVSIAGYSKIANDSDNTTYNWVKIAKVEEDGTIIGGCLIVYYDKDMNAISGEPNYNQYNTPNVSTYIKAGLGLKNYGTIPDEAVYFRALLESSSTTTNTLQIT